jgi:hypothetical protein
LPSDGCPNEYIAAGLMRSIVTLAVALSLAGCAAARQEARINEMDRNDDAACRSQPQVPYETCRRLRMQYRAQQPYAPSPGDDLDQRLRNAGAALQSIDRPPGITNNPMGMTCR